MSLRNSITLLVSVCLLASACVEAVASTPPQAPLQRPAAVESPDETLLARAVAEEYVRARSLRDSEATVALLSPDAIVIDTPAVVASEVPELFRFLDAVDWRVTATGCEQQRIDGSSQRASVSLTGTVEIICRYSSENAWSRAIGAGPIDGQFRMAIRGGLITELYHDYDVVTWEREVIGVFRAWLNTNHPEEDALVWETESFRRPDDADRNLPRRVVPALGDEAVAAVRELTAEFANAISG